jgi:hypothetical protein
MMLMTYKVKKLYLNDIYGISTFPMVNKGTEKITIGLSKLSFFLTSSHWYFNIQYTLFPLPSHSALQNFNWGAIALLSVTCS